MEIQWPLTFFSVLAGCGGVVLACTGLAELQGSAKRTRVPAVAAALILIVAGGCFSVLHLEQKANIMAAAANVFSFSAISLELVFVGLTAVFSVLYLLFRRTENSLGCKVAAVCGIVSGLLLAFVTGSGYRMEAQPNWNTYLLPIAYLTSNLASGSLVFLAIAAIRAEEPDEIRRFSLIAVACSILAIIGYIAYGAFVGFAADPLLLWLGCVVIGGVAACACAFMAKTKEGLALPFSLAGSVCSLVGAVCFRTVMWLLGTGWLDLFSVAAAHTIL